MGLPIDHMLLEQLRLPLQWYPMLLLSYKSSTYQLFTIISNVILCLKGNFIRYALHTVVQQKWMVRMHTTQIPMWHNVLLVAYRYASVL